MLIDTENHRELTPQELAEVIAEQRERKGPIARDEMLSPAQRHSCVSHGACNGWMPTPCQF